MEILTELTEWTGSSVMSLAGRFASLATPFNMVVTNVPGPPIPLYMLGSRLLEVYPMVPLFVNQGLGIAQFSNAGKLFWGFNADWDVLPDLHDFVGAIEASFAELCLAEPPPAPPPRHGRKHRQRAPRPNGEALPHTA